MTLDERQRYTPRTMRAGSFGLTGIRFRPEGDGETDAEKAEREKREREAADAAAAEKKFTQADLDRHIQERLARDRKERPSDDEIKELREAKKKLDEQEAASATELEKAQKRAETAEQAAAKALAEAKDTRLRSAILAEASKADRKIVDPEGALALLDKSKLELDADGNPTNIAEAMDALLEAKPYLAGGGTRAGTSVDQGARGNGAVTQLTSTEGMTAEQIADAVAKGELDTYLKTPK